MVNLKPYITILFYNNCLIRLLKLGLAFKASETTFKSGNKLN